MTSVISVVTFACFYKHFPHFPISNIFSSDLLMPMTLFYQFFPYVNVFVVNVFVVNVFCC